MLLKGFLMVGVGMIMMMVAALCGIYLVGVFMSMIYLTGNIWIVKQVIGKIGAVVLNLWI